MSLFKFNTQNIELGLFYLTFEDSIMVIRPFRRIVIGPNEHLRTADERLSLIRLSGTESAPEVQNKSSRIQEKSLLHFRLRLTYKGW